MDERTKELLQHLPKIDEMMLHLEKDGRLTGVPRELVKEACRSVVEGLRERILREKGDGTSLRLPTREAAAAQAAQAAQQDLERQYAALSRVLEALEFHWTPGLGHDWHLAKDAKAARFIQMHDCRVHVGHILKPGVAVWPDPDNTFRIG